MANDLDLPAIADGQADGQWQTSNDGNAALGNALADIYTVDFTAGNVTLTSAQFRSAMIFVGSNLSATRVLTLPAVKRPFWVYNPDAADNITVTKGATTVSVGPGELAQCYTDGTTDGLVGAVIEAGGGGGFVAESRQILSGTGMTGGGDLSADRTLSVDKATDANVRAATSNKVLTSDLIESASAYVTLTDAANISLDWDAGVNRALTLGGNRTLDNATNGQPGTWRSIKITQDGTGTRTLAYGNQYKFIGGTEPVLTTAAGSVDFLNIFCDTATSFFVFSALDMKV